LLNDVGPEFACVIVGRNSSSITDELH
jgi:hypothetical protein